MSFPRYPKYKASGVEWLGEVPEHWEVKPIRKAARLESGHTPSRNHPEYWANCTVPWFTLADVWQIREEGRDVIVETKEKVSELGLANSAARRLPAGTVMLSRTASVGFSAIMGVEMATTQDFANWVCGDGLLPKFLLHVCRSMQGEFRRLMMGSTHNTIYMPDIQAFRFALPPLAEQRAIAAFLDRETKKIDELVAEQERLIELLKEKRQAVISHAVTKGLDPAAPMKPSGVEWLGDVPAHWEVRRLRGLFRQTKRQDQDAKPVLSVYRDLGVVLKDSRDDNNNKTPEDLSLYQLVQPGDLVVNKMKAWQGSLGISSIEGITSPDYAVFVSRHTEEDAFLHLLLRSAAMVSQYLRISNGIRLDQWRLETDLFLNMEVFLPSPDEQRSIAENLGVKLRQVDELVAQAESAIALLTERRSALISAAVTGQVDVRNAVPEVSA
jgi:type I restriction enzyme S subunit